KDERQHVTKLTRTNVKNGYAVPITAEGVRRLKDAEVYPVGLQDQNTIDERGNVIPKKRVTHDLSHNQMLSDIRAAVRAIGPKVLGFTSNDVGTHSVRSSFAMMAYLAKEPVYTIMLIGRWSSTAFLSYIEPQIKEFTGGVSKRMLTHETFFHVSGATNPSDDTPTDREVFGRQGSLRQRLRKRS
ncbi:hypothetical protein THAOC_14393, partial [Thalassiosira oceanica]